MSSLKNKVVVITGASSGIGKAIALEAAKKGAHLVLAARNLQTLNEVAQQCSDYKNQVLVVPADVSVEKECENIITKTIEHFGTIDVLINNAGISMRAIFEDTDLKVLKSIMDINFWGTVYCTKYALPYILKNKGSVVGISSIAGYKGLPARTGYSASKFAMQGFLESLRIENLKKDLHVLIACPGFTASNIRNTALAADGSQQGESPRDEGKMMQPKEVAFALMRAIEGRKRTLTLTTQGKLLVFLNKFIPGQVDRLVFNQMAKEPDSPFNRKQ